MSEPTRDTDFRVLEESSLKVARWAVCQTPFDRLYFYNEQLPIHVSIAFDPIGQIVEIGRSKSGRRTPIVRSREYFLSLDRL